MTRSRATSSTIALSRRCSTTQISPSKTTQVGKQIGFAAELLQTRRYPPAVAAKPKLWAEPEEKTDVKRNSTVCHVADASATLPAFKSTFKVVATRRILSALFNQEQFSENLGVVASQNLFFSIYEGSWAVVCKQLTCRIVNSTSNFLCIGNKWCQQVADWDSIYSSRQWHVMDKYLKRKSTQSGSSGP